MLAVLILTRTNLKHFLTIVDIQLHFESFEYFRFEKLTLIKKVCYVKNVYI